MHLGFVFFLLPVVFFHLVATFKTLQHPLPSVLNCKCFRATVAIQLVLVCYVWLHPAKPSISTDNQGHLT